MENGFMRNVSVYTDELKPRTVQTLVMRGVTFAVFTNTVAPAGVRIFEDIDGTKLLGYVPAAEADAAPEALTELLDTLPETMPDIPVYKIEGKPDDTALTYPANGILQGAVPMDVNAGNIALKEMTDGNAPVLVLAETAGRETAFALYCEAYDFGFKALFAPYEVKRFVADADGRVEERNFPDDLGNRQ